MVIIVQLEIRFDTHILVARVVVIAMALIQTIHLMIRSDGILMMVILFIFIFL